MSDELDRYTVYVSECDHTHGHKVSDLEDEHELDCSTSVAGEWCRADEVEQLEVDYAEALAEKDSLQEDLEKLQEEYNEMERRKTELEDAAGDVVSDGEEKN
jgi:hypothetical protein